MQIPNAGSVRQSYGHGCGCLTALQCQPGLFWSGKGLKVRKYLHGNGTVRYVRPSIRAWRLPHILKVRPRHLFRSFILKCTQIVEICHESTVAFQIVLSHFSQGVQIQLKIPGSHLFLNLFGTDSCVKLLFRMCVLPYLQNKSSYSKYSIIFYR